MDKSAAATRQDIDGILDVLSEMMARIDERFTFGEQRQEKLDSRMDSLETKVDNLDSKVDRLDSRISRLGKGQIVVLARLNGVDKRLELLETNRY